VVVVVVVGVVVVIAGLRWRTRDSDEEVWKRRRCAGATGFGAAEVKVGGGEARAFWKKIILSPKN
jgi:hypothetical protein